MRNDTPLAVDNRHLTVLLTTVRVVAMADRCPHLADYDPLSTEQLRDPFPTYKKARKEAPVFFDDKLGVWSVTRMDDVLTVLRDPATFTSTGSFEMRRSQLPDELAKRWPAMNFRALTTIDPPEHTPVRKLMQKAFTPRRVAELEPFVGATTERLIDSFCERGSADLMKEFANPLPLLTITRILGFDPVQAPQLRQWTEDTLVMATPAGNQPDENRPPDAETLERIERIVEVREEARALMQERRRKPENDLTSALVEGADNGDLQISDEDLITLLLEMALAGNDTTANLITHTVDFLLADRAQWDELVADPALIPNAVEEGLRRRGSIRGLFRRATKDVELDGADIHQGDVLHVLYSSAGHDEKYFSDPERFDLHRENAKDHVSFGRWTHFCLGAPLARLESRVALEALSRRLPDLHEAPGQELDYAPTITTHTLLSYLVGFTPVGVSDGVATA